MRRASPTLLLIALACALGLLTLPNADAQSGPYSAQIQRALATFTAKPVLIADGTQAAPAIAFASDPGTGWYSGGASALQWSAGGVARGRLNATEIKMISTVGLSWAPSGNLNTASDTSIVRAAAGELTYTSIAFAALGTPANGTVAFCSDCTETTPATCPVTQASCVCAGSGTGAFARRVNGAWYCTF